MDENLVNFAVATNVNLINVVNVSIVAASPGKVFGLGSGCWRRSVLTTKIRGNASGRSSEADQC